MTPTAPTPLREVLPADLALSMHGQDTKRRATREAAALIGRPIQRPRRRELARILLPYLPVIVAIIAFIPLAVTNVPDDLHFPQPAAKTAPHKPAASKPKSPVDKITKRPEPAQSLHELGAHYQDALRRSLGWLLVMALGPIAVMAVVTRNMGMLVLMTGALAIVLIPPAALVGMLPWLVCVVVLLLAAGYATATAIARYERFEDAQLAQVHPHIRGRVVATTRDDTVINNVELLVPKIPKPGHAGYVFDFDFDVLRVERTEFPGWALEDARAHAAGRRAELEELEIDAERAWLEEDATRRAAEGLPPIDPEVLEAERTAALINAPDHRPGAWT